MPRLRQPSPRPTAKRPPVVVERISLYTLSGIIYASALAAACDGHASPEERRSLVVFLRDRNLLNPHGRRRVLRAYEAALAGLREQPLERLPEAANGLCGLRGTSGALHAAAAACKVVLADGVVWPQEEAVIAIIHDRLGLRAAGVGGDARL
jgi:tellurite resistance protein